MSRDPAPEAGRLVDGAHHLPVRIYYEDTDFSGVVYHAAYLRFMERGRTEALRLCGLDHAGLLQGDAPLAFAVRRMNIEFVRPAHIDDGLVVRTRFASARGARLEARQEIFREDELLVSADVQIASIHLDGRPRRLPPAIVAAMAPLATGN